MKRRSSFKRPVFDPANPRYSTFTRSRSTKRAAEERQYNARFPSWQAENPRCCFPGCRSETAARHHRFGRVGARLLDESGWVPCCWKHHRFIHDNPAEAKKLGLYH